MTRISPLSLRLLFTLALAAVVLTGTPPPPAHAQTPPMVIAIVDLQVILRDSKAAAGARVALDKQAKGFQADLAKQEDALKNEGQQLQQMEQNAMDQVQSALTATVSDVAKARNISLVLVKGLVLYNLPAFDITAEVLQKLDAKLPSVKLTAAK